MLKVCSFYHNHLCTSSSQKKCQNSKRPILGNGLKTCKCTCALLPVTADSLCVYA